MRRVSGAVRNAPATRFARDSRVGQRLKSDAVEDLLARRAGRGVDARGEVGRFERRRARSARRALRKDSSTAYSTIIRAGRSLRDQMMPLLGVTSPLCTPQAMTGRS